MKTLMIHYTLKVRLMRIIRIIFCLFFCYFLLANYAMANSKPGFSVISMNEQTINNYKGDYLDFCDTNLVKESINTKICTWFYLPDVSKFENKPLGVLVDTLKKQFPLLKYDFRKIDFNKISKEEEQYGTIVQFFFKVDNVRFLKLIGVIYFQKDSALKYIDNLESFYLSQNQYIVSLYIEPVSYLISIWAEDQKNKAYDFIYKSEVDMILNNFPNKVKELKKKVNLKKINMKK